MHPMLNIAVRAANAAGDIIYKYSDHIDSLTIENKAQNDFVSEVDKQAEQAIIKTIKSAYPDHSFKAEESGERKNSNEDYTWIIDPLDGTTNFLHGFPQYAVSIALKEKGKITQAVVYEPLTQELYTASRGEGAMLNNRRIRVSNRKSLEGALLGTGFPFKQQQHLDIYLETFKAVFPMTAGIRRPGSAALDLAYVAAGRLDGFWEIGLNDWDMAAGTLLVHEAGGLLGDFSGGHEYLQSGNVICGNPKVFKQLIQKIIPIVSSTFEK
ncbi:MAG: inositol-1-monophosphatase [Gammaproteobacteria bacterium]|nr:inositol-1-monophosphatase [Gammaproteobacteria bacterium]